MRATSTLTSQVKFEQHMTMKMKFGLLSLAILVFAAPASADEPFRSPESASVAARIREHVAESRRALKMSRELAGYDEFERSFRLEDAHLGSVNSMPESLFVELRSTKPQTIDAAWWWNILSDGKPSLSWRDFLAAYTSAERTASKHRWLSEYKRLPGKRSLELHLLGTGVGVSADDMATFLLPVWKHAGMAGEPAYCLLARRGNAWVELLFSDRDERAFVPSTSMRDPNPQSPLDGLDVNWHPRGKRGESYSKYAIVEPDGRVRVETYVMDEP